MMVKMWGVYCLVYHQVVLPTVLWVKIRDYTGHGAICLCTKGGVIALDCSWSIKIKNDKCIAA